MEFLRQFWMGLAQAWRRLSLSARVNIALAAAATAGIIVMLVVIGSQPEYVTLYSQLSLEESGKIQSYLSDQSILFKTEDGGATILVPIQDRSRARVGLAGQGLPTSQGAAPGFEVFDRQDLMTNQWLQNVNYMRAVQGALQRQLDEFDFVRRSFVFIREAPEQLFVSEQKPSEAAVTLDVNRPLSPKEVKAVLAMVSSFGGANLNPNNVTLTTTSGQVLHLPAENEFASIANSKLDYIAELEQQRQKRAEDALSSVGVRSVVRVSADVDFDKVKETQTAYSEGTPVSSWSSTTTTTSKEPQPEGPPGASSNLPGGVSAGAGSNESTTEETIENYQPTSVTTERAMEPGTVKSYRVSAFVEGEYRPAEGGNGEQEYVPLTDEQIAKYKDMIAAAVGVGVSAADITVYDHPFRIDHLAQTGTPSGQTATSEWQGRMVQFGEVAAKLALVFIGFLLVRRLLNRAIVAPPREEAAEIPEASAEDMRRQEVAREVERLSREQPETVAALLRSWMSEEEE